MTLTTHDWSVFFTLAVTRSPNGGDVVKTCASVARLRTFCMRFAALPCTPCDAELNEDMLNTLRHLIHDHGLQPVPRGTLETSPLTRSLAPFFFRTHRWIENNAPEMHV